MEIRTIRDRSTLAKQQPPAAPAPVHFPEISRFDLQKQDFSAVIFDFDGTLVDSMWVWEEIDVRFCDRYGLELPDGYHEQITALTFEDTARFFREDLGLNMSVEQIAYEFNEMAYEPYATRVLCKTGVKRYLETLRERGVPIAIATSLPWSLLEAGLDGNEIAGFFDDIAFCDESAAKSESDVYLLAAERVGARPEDCLVFEDLATGIRSARRAGMTVCAVLDHYLHQDWTEMRAVSDFSIQSFEELL